MMRDLETVIWYNCESSKPGQHNHEYKIKDGVVYSRSVPSPQWASTLYKYKSNGDFSLTISVGDFGFALAPVPDGLKILRKEEWK